MIGPPAALLQDLAALPPGSGAWLVLRHGRRAELPADAPGDEVPLTLVGRAQAATLGAWLGPRLGAVRTSPVLRCRQTAEAILSGAGLAVAPEPDPLLGAPGPFVIDGEAAWPLFLRHGVRGLARQQLGAASLPGLRPAAEGCALLLAGVLSQPVRPGQVGLHVTHDLIIALLVASLFHEPDPEALWPDFLEGIVLWHEGQEITACYRGRLGRTPVPR